MYILIFYFLNYTTHFHTLFFIIEKQTTPSKYVYLTFFQGEIVSIEIAWKCQFCNVEFFIIIIIIIID